MHSYHDALKIDIEVRDDHPCSNAKCIRQRCEGLQFLAGGRWLERSLRGPVAQCARKYFCGCEEEHGGGTTGAYRERPASAFQGQSNEGRLTNRTVGKVLHETYGYDRIGPTK